MRGARWELHRRTVDESSAILANYDEVLEQLALGWDRTSPNATTKAAERTSHADDAGYRFSIPVQQRTRPGMRGMLHLEAHPWS